MGQGTIFYAACAVVLMTGLLPPGCAASPAVDDAVREPAWIGHFGVFDTGQGRFLEAVGSSSAEAHPGTRRAMALANGRSQLALVVQALGRSLAEEVVVALRPDFTDGLAEGGVFAAEIGRQVSDQVLHAGQEATDGRPQRWTDPITRTTYVHMQLDVEFVLKAYRTQMARAFARESTLGAVRAGEEQFSAIVDDQLQRLAGQGPAAWLRRLPAHAPRRNDPERLLR